MKNLRDYYYKNNLFLTLSGLVLIIIIILVLTPILLFCLLIIGIICFFEAVKNFFKRKGDKNEDSYIVELYSRPVKRRTYKKM